MVLPEVSEPVLPVRANPVALPALVVGIVAVLLGAALSLGTYAAIGSAGALQTVTLLSAIRTITVSLLGFVALALGLVGVLLPRRVRRATAAAGLAIGAVLVFEGLSSLLAAAVANA